ncbi:SPFH domain-containing protein [Desulfogranum japonicum]|uniref:SPFH domain-containing protein n=1 Tax=Desulfogranum japonicum TaxID=231447 RepID=UPI00040C9BA1|nr:SPFH domain-containing protein [Desulfogranum japonicum]
MFGINYFKADSSTYIIRSAGGNIVQEGKGLCFFYNTAYTSIEAIPMSIQEAPFIFSLQTADYQEIRIQGQAAYQIAAPARIAAMLNFTVKENGRAYISEDPMKLSDQVVRVLQSFIQVQVQSVTLRKALKLNQQLVELIKENLSQKTSLAELGIALVDITISSISPSPETARALEAEAREAILQEADDAIYLRRKSSVEQERTIREAELQTELIVQTKEQEIQESRIANERKTLRGKNETEQEKMTAKIEIERRRRELVEEKAANDSKESDAEAYAIAARMRAFTELPVENLKALTLAGMNPEQLMAMALESLAGNAQKIGELNIGQEVFGQILRKAVQK